MTGEAAGHDLSAALIAAALTTRRLGRPTLFFERVGSTNDVAHARAEAGAPEGLLVVADEQTAGRGRLDRSWWAPPGASLLISLLLRPLLPAGRAGQLTMCLGLGALEGIEAVTALRPALKWPNDLLLEGRKLGGMLTELRTDGDRLAYTVLGLGLNVNLAFDSISRKGAESQSHQERAAPPEGLAATAASLMLALGRPVDRLALLVAILGRCEAWYDRLLASPEDPVIPQAWSARLDTLGRAVTVATPGGILHGVAAGVSPEGALLLRDDDGQCRTLWAGDVTAVR